MGDFFLEEKCLICNFQDLFDAKELKFSLMSYKTFLEYIFFQRIILNEFLKNSLKLSACFDHLLGCRIWT